MDTNLAQKAVDNALAGRWAEAVETNKKILKETPSDVDALNRLARAFSELGDIASARKTAEKVLKIDPINTIATKCLDKWKGASKFKKEKDVTIDVVDAFLEEPGKTKMVTLLHPGDEKKFANLDPGEQVKLIPFAHRVSVMTSDGVYIGRLPDDLATRLKSLMKLGNKYRVLVKSIDAKKIDVFIRELQRGKLAMDVNSFPPEKIDYVAFTPPELVHRSSPIGIGENLIDAEGEE